MIGEKAYQLLANNEYRAAFEERKEAGTKEAAYKWIFKHACRMMFAEKFGLFS